MSKKTVLIVGSSGYLGSQLVTHFHEHDWQVLALSKSAHPDTILCDITDEASVMSVSDALKKKGTSLDACIISTSPPIVRKSVTSLTKKEFDEHIAVHVDGTFLVAKYFGHLMAPRAVFIGVTSEVLRNSVSNVGSYAIAKSALRMLLKQLSNEWKTVRVYAVSPGFMEGGLNSDIPEKVTQFLKSKDPSAITDVAHVAESVFSVCMSEDDAGGVSLTMDGSRESL